MLTFHPCQHSNNLNYVCPPTTHNKFQLPDVSLTVWQISTAHCSCIPTFSTLQATIYHLSFIINSCCPWISWGISHCNKCFVWLNAFCLLSQLLTFQKTVCGTCRFIGNLSSYIALTIIILTCFKGLLQLTNHTLHHSASQSVGFSWGLHWICYHCILNDNLKYIYLYIISFTG